MRTLRLFFAALPRADRPLAWLWWTVVVLHGVLPALFAVAMGALVAAVERSATGGGASLAPPLAAVGVIFVLLQVLSPLQTAVSHNLGDRTAAHLYDRLTRAAVTPPGMGHLEDPSLTSDLTVAREFDRGMTGPPLTYSLDFIAGGLVGLVAGIASALVLLAYRWWAPLVLAGVWLATHWLLRESAVWRDRNTDVVRSAQRDAEYAYRLAVDPPAAKEVRLFGLASWVIDRFVARRTRLHMLQYEATRLRERPLVWCVLLVVAGNLLVFLSLVAAAAAGTIDLGQLVMYAQCAVGASAIAFGGLNWALDGAAAPVDAITRLEPVMAASGALPSGTRSAAGLPAHEIRFRNVTFAYKPSVASASSAAPSSVASVSSAAPASGPSVSSAAPVSEPSVSSAAPVSEPSASSAAPASVASASSAAPVLSGFDLTIPAGSSLAIVGQNGAGKTTLAKLLCRLYDPQAGAIEVDGIDVRELDMASWRSQLAAVFQDFTRFEWPLRDNVAPMGAPDDVVRNALDAAGASGLAGLDTILARGYDDGTDLSGGQWQRIALARALAAVRMGAGVVLLDEPTAQLDVRGEAEIFERILSATRGCTTILISHRFSTVRRVDRIAVLEGGRLVELGTHDELMARGGRYKTMFDMQAERFGTTDEEGTAYDVLS